MSGPLARRLGLVALCLAMTGCVVASIDDPFDRGVLAYQDGRYQQALFDFDAAVGRNPTAAAHANRAIVLVRLGHLSAALADYDRAIALAPDDPTTYFNRGNAHVMTGAYGRAIADFTRAIELSPGDARAHHNRSAARRLAGDPRWLEDLVTAGELETDPWEKARIRKRLDPDSAPPATPPASQAVSGGAMLDARALATRGLSRALDGDRAGALADLRAALSLERDPARRARIEALVNALK